MNTKLLQYTVLRAASILAPGDQRAEWMKEWRSELWYVPRRQAMLFSLGAFQDALWLRRHSPRSKIDLESPFSCLALLSTLAAASIVIAFHLPVRWKAPDLPGICIGMPLFAALFLPGTLAVWRSPANRHPMPWPIRLRRGVFLALKIVLVQPIMLCALFIQAMAGSLGVFMILEVYAAVILVLRWVITDQQQRCPVCLRLLTAPVQIGTSARTFLEWYGVESTCSRGHGLLHISKDASSFSRKPQWLSLDDSWSGLFKHDA